jgi:GMP synthase (glutamine-hydrolysing)
VLHRAPFAESIVRRVRVLAIVHQADAGPGVFSGVIRDAGASLDCWIPARDARPPDGALAYDAVLTLGGAMHPDQEKEHPWLAREKSLLSACLDREVPVLGVCLGAELLAEAAGAGTRRAAGPEIGWYEVETTDEAPRDPLLAPLAPRFEALEWHSYESPLPPGAVALARSETCLQAYRAGSRAWGIQFHAEVTLDDFETWLDDYRSDPDALAIDLDVSDLRLRTREAIERWNELGRELCARFLDVAAASDD